MSLIGNGGNDLIRQVLGSVVNIFKKKRAICTSPCDGLILKMHYQWSFWLFLTGFSAVWYSWYHRDVITCVSHFNAEGQVRLDYVNICLSYPYLLIGDEKRFLLFYRWTHWTLLVLAFCFYIPRKFSKNSENPKLKKLVEDLATFSHRYDQTERELVERAARFFAYNLNTHNGIYFKFLGCNIIALVVDIFCFQFLDFIFQERFIHYGWKAYPYYRDAQNFTDHMSDTFPPFVNCKITREYMLTAGREEVLGCHLILMELYEKVFLFIWLWLIILMIITFAYIIFLCFMWFPYFRLMILRVSKPATARNSVSDAVMNVLSCCKIGDVYLLYRLRQHLSHARFYELLSRLSHPELLKMLVADPTERSIFKDNHDIHRNIKRGVGGKKLNDSDHLFIPNTSILVE